MTDFLKTFDLKYFNLLNPRMNWQKAGTSENLCQRGTDLGLFFKN